MTLREARHSQYQQAYPRLGEGDYSLLWHSDFWDGAISGMLVYRGARRWFEMIEENSKPGEEKWYRRFAVVTLSEDQLARECAVHDDFRKYVGTHTDYEGDFGPDRIKPQDQHYFFYDQHHEYCQVQRFEECEVVAWFEH